jgi:hypothetical protein
MNLHHQNIKALCQHVESWIQCHLHQLGVAGFACNFLNLKQGTFLPLGTDYQNYCEYMAQGHHLQMAQRLQPGIQIWQSEQSLYQLVQETYQTAAPMHMFDWTIKTAYGFELFVVVSKKPMQFEHLIKINHQMRVFSALGHQINKQKPHALLELEAADAIAEKFQWFERQGIIDQTQHWQTDFRPTKPFGFRPHR